MKSLYLAIQKAKPLKSSEHATLVDLVENYPKTSEALKIRNSYRLRVLATYPLLLKFRDEILNNPELYAVEIKTTWFGTTLTRDTPLFLGDFLQFWQDEPWRRNCPKCNTKTLFIFGAAGSLLSGGGGGGGVCTKCKEEHSVHGIHVFFSSVIKVYALSRKAEGSTDPEASVLSRKLKKSSISLEQVITGAKQCIK